MTVLWKSDAMEGTCAVTYRGTASNGEMAEIRLYRDPAAATLADAWQRLCTRYGWIDPRTIEIELRELPPSTGTLPIHAQIYV
jgi:hypothetical protein